MREKYSTTHVKSDIGDVIGTSAIARQSNVHSCKRGMFDHCFDSVVISSLRKVVVFVASFCAGFYYRNNRITATCSPSQERQLVLMESMNRRLDSFLASQKKLEEKNATLQQENVKLRTELSKQERLNNTKRGSKRKRTEAKVEVPMDLRVGLRTYFIALMLEEKLFMVRDQSLCLFVRADRVIACLQRRRHSCVVKHHRSLQTHIVFPFAPNFSI